MPYSFEAAKQAGQTLAERVLERHATRQIQARKASRGLIIAEGDSWFDYPIHDVLKFLEDDHNYEVNSVAHKGDRIEDMAYSEGQLDSFTRLLIRALHRDVNPKAILLSGGGNDIAGNVFGMLLNHSQSGIAGLNESIAAGMIDERLADAYTTIITSITTVCESIFNEKIKVIVHGYAYPIPDGRGFLGGFWLLPGPWLAPGFRLKGYGDEDLVRRIAILKTLIDKFNNMLSHLPEIEGFDHVRYLDFRNIPPESDGTNYKEWWGNELHPTKEGFAQIAKIFANEIG